MPGYLLIIYAVIGLALATAAYSALGGRAIFGTRERPERILGRRCQLRVLESGPHGLPPRQSMLPAAAVETITREGLYLLRFETSWEWRGIAETHALVSGRHRGYPVSSTAGLWTRGVVVNGRFGGGEQFTAVFRLLPRSGGI
jgi:hypothetical protein